jgi:hypothetical protein
MCWPALHSGAADTATTDLQADAIGRSELPQPSVVRSTSIDHFLAAHFPLWFNASVRAAATATATSPLPLPTASVPVLKIDTSGNDYRVLIGAQELLSCCAVERSAASCSSIVIR